MFTTHTCHELSWYISLTTFVIGIPGISKILQLYVVSVPRFDMYNLWFLSMLWGVFAHQSESIWVFVIGFFCLWTWHSDNPCIWVAQDIRILWCSRICNAIWTILRSERPVSTIFSLYIMCNQTYGTIKNYDTLPLSDQIDQISPPPFCKICFSMVLECQKYFVN